MNIRVTRRRVLVAGAAAVAIVAGTVATVMATSGSPSRPVGCPALADWYTSTGAPAAGKLAADVNALTPLDIASWTPLQTDATAAPGYPAGQETPLGGPARAFTADWAAYLQDFTVGAQLHDTATLQSGLGAEKRALADLKRCA
jgi:hypothetical protein